MFFIKGAKIEKVSSFSSLIPGFWFHFMTFYLKYIDDFIFLGNLRV